MLEPDVMRCTCLTMARTLALLLLATVLHPAVARPDERAYMQRPPLDEAPPPPPPSQAPNDEAQALPPQLDLREKYPKCVGERIYNQGRCASCWAFAATTTLEARWCIANAPGAESLWLSPQDLMDCEHLNVGCKMGSLPQWAWSFLVETGVTAEECIPYESGRTGHSDKCSNDCVLAGGTKPVYKAKDVVHLKGVEAIMRALQDGPVDVTFNVYGDFEELWALGNLPQYRDVVYSKGWNQRHDTGGYKGLHSVTLVGYGTINATDYWLIQNSWGKSGGIDDSGFIRMRRGTNECGVETLAYTGWPAA